MVPYAPFTISTTFALVLHILLTPIFRPMSLLSFSALLASIFVSSGMDMSINDRCSFVGHAVLSVRSIGCVLLLLFVPDSTSCLVCWLRWSGL